MRCGDCRYWGDPLESGAFRSCGAIVHDRRNRTDTNEWSDAETLLQDFDRADPHEVEEVAKIKAMREHKAVIWDRSGYFAALKCREDFGCVLFQAKGA